MAKIVVGLDGSVPSRQALKWAVAEAAAHGAPLEVVAVHQVAIDSWGMAPVRTAADEPERAKVQAAAQQIVDGVVAEAGPNVPPSVQVIAVTGIPAETLVEVSRDADQLIVGSHGAAGFGRSLVGTVTSRVVHHAVCPVTIIPVRKKN